MSVPRNPFAQDAGYMAARYSTFAGWFVVYRASQRDEFLIAGLNWMVESKKTGEMIYTRTLEFAKVLMIAATSEDGFERWNDTIRDAVGNIDAALVVRRRRHL